MASRLDIPEGRANAISRAQLARLWHCSDRAARHTIADFRAESSSDPCVILSTSSEPAGYWRSRDPVEIAEFIRETEARARNTFLALREARRLLNELQRNGQTMLDLDGTGA